MPAEQWPDDVRLPNALPVPKGVALHALAVSDTPPGDDFLSASRFPSAKFVFFVNDLDVLSDCLRSCLDRIWTQSTGYTGDN